METSISSGNLFDVIVVGAGHAGLSISYFLRQHSLSHVVFERGRIGETWLSQRWDSFALNTANKTNMLPGQVYSGYKPDEFGSATEFVNSLQEYTRINQLPVVEFARVTSITKSDHEDEFGVAVMQNGAIKNFRTKQVVVASGIQNEKRIPSFAKNISADIHQLHACEYRNTSQLPDGAVIVVGGGQSGCQIAEDLAEQGRKVYLSTSMVARVPRRYRDRDIVDWLSDMGFYDVQTETVTDPKVLKMRVPLLSGIGALGHTLSYQLLAQKGVIILGKMENADTGTLFFAGNASDHIKFADGFSKKAKDMIDEYILQSGMKVSEPQEDIGDMPDSYASCASAITSLNLAENNITSIIWSTGFGGDYSFLKLPVDFGTDGAPAHKNGISEIVGLYYLGLPWLRMRKSGMVLGIRDDAEFIAEAVIKNHLKNLN